MKKRVEYKVISSLMNKSCNIDVAAVRMYSSHTGFVVKEAFFF